MNDEHKIIVASDERIFIRSFNDISEAVAACIGGDGLILTENDLAPEFFDLHTGLAGELFQKFTNYHLRVAIVVPEPRIYGARFSELANEHRSHDMIRIVSTLDEANFWLRSSE